MWPSTRLTKLLSIEHPIIQAPMAGASSPAMAAAVSNSGGLGSLGCAMFSAEKYGHEVQATQSATNRPVNMNFFVHKPPEVNEEKNKTATEQLAPFYDELGLNEIPPIEPLHFPFDEHMLEAVLAKNLSVVSFHFGLPDNLIVSALKQAGLIVMSSATSVREARDLEQRGCDAIIAQGLEAGGHRGTYLSSEEGARIGTMSLVPQIVDAVEVPVIAAGGIADGRGIAAAFALGADGVQIGTAFLNCPESVISDTHKRALLHAREDETCLTPVFSGRPARGLNNRYIEQMSPHAHKLPEFPLMNTLTGPLRKVSAETNSPDFIALWSGQSMTLNRELPASELFLTLVDEAQTILSH
ncbi:MAG: NAD(P)H-dependent flavin oxidoreductase [Hyphomicrobiales bacterium]